MKLYQALENFKFTTVKIIRGQAHLRIDNRVWIQPNGTNIDTIYDMLKLIKNNLTGN